MITPDSAARPRGTASIAGNLLKLISLTGPLLTAIMLTRMRSSALRGIGVASPALAPP